MYLASSSSAMMRPPNAMTFPERLRMSSQKEIAAELLLEAKGFSNAVVSVTDGNVDVVINSTKLDDTLRAQVEDIVKRKTGVSADKITINICNN